jgi:hypothetical protein
MNPTKWAWDKNTWAGIGLGAVIGGAAGVGFYYAAPALAKTGFFTHFQASGVVAAYTITGAVTGGLAGYGSGFSGGMLYSNGDWSYSHKSGVHGAKVGATIGAALGFYAGLYETYEPPRKPKQRENRIRLYEHETRSLYTDDMLATPIKGGTMPSYEIGELTSSHRLPNSYYERALLYEDTPYFAGGSCFNGIDCSGLYSRASQSARWYTWSGPIPGNMMGINYTHTRAGFLSTARTGDVLFWPNRHVAFYAGDGRLFHARGSQGTPTGITNDLFRWWIPNRGWPLLYRQY